MSETRPLRIVLYARVSTRDQSADMQIGELRRFAEARGWEVVDEFVDAGVSGATTSRPEFDRMMDQLRRREAGALLCWRFDRIGRSTSHLLGVLEELRSLNVGFISITEAIDTTTSVGRMVFTFLAALAEFERSLIQERVAAGIRNAKERGVRFGRPRAGFDAARALEMRRQGSSLRAIAKAVGVSTATVCRALRSLQEAFHKPDGQEGR